MPHLVSKFTTLLRSNIFKEASFYSLANLTSQVLSFGSIFFVSRYLGPVNLGLLSFVQNYAAIYLSIIAGADYYFSWNIGTSGNKLDTIRQFVVHKLRLGATLSIIGIVLAYFTLPADVFWLTVVYMLPIMLHASSAFYLYAIYEKRAKAAALIQITSSVILFLIKLLLVLSGAPLIANNS